jgi:hypothetical protein
MSSAVVEGSNIVASNGNDIRVLMRVLAQISFAKKGLIPTHPDHGKACNEGAEDENTTIFHVLSILGLYAGDKPHPGACGCFFIQTPENIEANAESVRVALGRPQLVEKLRAVVDALTPLSETGTASKDTRCFFDLSKCVGGKIVYCHLAYPVYDSAKLFVEKKVPFLAIEAPKPKSKAVQAPAGVVKNFSSTPTIRAWGNPEGAAAAAISASVAKAKRIHVNPVDAEAEALCAEKDLQAIEDLIAQRRKDVENAKAVKKAKEKRDAALSALAERQEQLKALDEALAAAQ